MGRIVYQPLTTYAAFVRRDLLIDLSYTLSFIMRWVGILISVFMFYYLSRLIGGRGAGYLAEYGGSYFAFVLVGLATISYLDACINGFAATVAREQWAGTLEVLLTTPTKLPHIFFACTLYNFCMGLLAAGLYLFLGGFLGVHITVSGLGAALLILLLGTVVFSSLGMLAASCIIVFKRGDPITWVVANLFWLLGGTYFPITVFPVAIQRISHLIPSTYLLRAVRRALLQGYSTAMLKGDIFVLVLFSVVLSMVGIFVLRKALVYAKRRGTIAFY